MRTVAVILQIFLLFLAGSGCEPAPPVEPLSETDNGPDELTIYTRYTPVRINITPLTEFIRIGDSGDGSKVKIYVSLLDSFGCQVKSPGVFRFELYDYVKRSAEPKGKRIAIWPDINLTDVAENNSYWRDFLRAYEFNLDFEPQGSQSYILEVTFLSPSGKRLPDEFCLNCAR